MMRARRAERFGRGRFNRPEFLQKGNLTRLYSEERKSTFEIARLVGCSRDAVVRELRYHRIPIRYGVYRTEAHKMLVRELRKLIPVEDWQVDYRPEGFNYRIDIAFPEIMFAVEVDGYWHQYKEDDDRKRQEELEEAGWTFLRFSNREIWSDVGSCAARLSRNFHEREAACSTAG